ncbi:MAG: hypothetical protein V4681_02540 [Patescibacteria group bacterium]
MENTKKGLLVEKDDDRVKKFAARLAREGCEPILRVRTMEEARRLYRRRGEEFGRFCFGGNVVSAEDARYLGREEPFTSPYSADPSRQHAA